MTSALFTGNVYHHQPLLTAMAGLALGAMDTSATIAFSTVLYSSTSCYTPATQSEYPVPACRCHDNHGSLFRNGPVVVVQRASSPQNRRRPEVISVVVGVAMGRSAHDDTDIVTSQRLCGQKSKSKSRRVITR